MAQVVRFAKDNGILPHPIETLRYLDGYACRVDDGDGVKFTDRTRTRCIMWRDWSPWSFNFLMERRRDANKMMLADAPTNIPGYQRWFNGGVIFHKGAEAGCSAPQFSVTLSGRSDARWEVHT